jgi:hypothetical protein
MDVANAIKYNPVSTNEDAGGYGTRSDPKFDDRDHGELHRDWQAPA